MNISEVIGQVLVKRAIEIALSGNHSILLVGPQGSGKTMWGKLIKSISSKNIVIDNIDDSIGHLYHTLSDREASSSGILVCTTRSCPCGNMTHPHLECRCGVFDVIQYRNVVPMWAWRAFDLKIETTIPRPKEFRLDFLGETTNEILERVSRIRKIQDKRFSGYNEIAFNSQMPPHLIKCQILYLYNNDLNLLLQAAVKELGLCVGDYFSILRVARTIADMAESKDVKIEHVSEAIQYKNFDWYLKIGGNSCSQNE